MKTALVFLAATVVLYVAGTVLKQPPRSGWRGWVMGSLLIAVGMIGTNALWRP